MLSRRTFFTGSTSALALVATGGLGTSRKAYAQEGSSPDPNIYGALNAANSVVLGDVLYKGVQAEDFDNMQNALTACLNEWNANGRNAGVAANLYQVNPASIVSANIDQTSLLQYLRIYTPQMDEGDIQTMLAFIDNNQVQVADIIYGIQINGFSYYISMLADGAAQVADHLRNPGPVAMGRTIKPHLMRVGANRPGPGAGCAWSGVAIGAAGLAFAVIGVMSFGTAPVLVGAAWAGISVWGGMGAGAAWGGHLALCNS